jgi:hypothetical protein
LAADMPYSVAHSRIPDIFQSIKSAGTPPKFNNEFLRSSLGFTSSNDRAIISILRKLNFISSSGEPTQRYNEFKGHENGKALAKGLREGWGELFMADQKIHDKSVNDVAKRVTTITGANERTAKYIAGTFVALAQLADWTHSDQQPADPPGGQTTKSHHHTAPAESQTEQPAEIRQNTLSLHHDIHIHLPTTSDATVYRAVFQAIKAELL